MRIHLVPLLAPVVVGCSSGEPAVVTTTSSPSSSDAAASAAASGARPEPAASAAPSSATAAPSAAAPSASVQPVGLAKILPDGTIELSMFSPHALLRYPKSDPHYADVLAHVGPIKPGEQKAVAPFPEKWPTK